MNARLMIDTGPLVALLNARDAYHAWTIDQLKQAEPPLITCEAVLSETFFLLRSAHGGVEQLAAFLRSGEVVSRFSLDAELRPVCALLAKYADVPMSLADACLVRMSELNADFHVLTLDSDFRQYRRHGKQMIPSVMPDR
jgi:predicted nucleic acid-binding protein